MKKYTANLLAVFASFPGAQSMAYLDWNVASVTGSSIQSITFPMSMAGAPHEDGFYFAQQYNFNSRTSSGYIGLQPRPDNTTGPVVHGVFSAWTSKCITDDPNCHCGADYADGVSCKVDINGNYSHLYHLRVENIGGSKWKGTLIDSTTGVETRIGSYTLPADATSLQPSQGGFLEYYHWNDGKSYHDCRKLPYTEVFYGNPFTLAGTGAVGNASEQQNACDGNRNFKATPSKGGLTISVGYKADR